MATFIVSLPETVDNSLTLEYVALSLRYTVTSIKSRARCIKRQIYVLS